MAKAWQAIQTSQSAQLADQMLRTLELIGVQIGEQRLHSVILQVLHRVGVHAGETESLLQEERVHTEIRTVVNTPRVKQKEKEKKANKQTNETKKHTKQDKTHTTTNTTTTNNKQRTYLSTENTDHKNTRTVINMADRM
jgi:uncharacterized Ntn-hydrolase superfamily protein